MNRPLSYPHPPLPKYQLLEAQDPRKGANGGNGGKGGGAGVGTFAPSNRNTTTRMSGAALRTMKPHEFGSQQFITPAQLRRRRQSRSLVRLFLICTLCSVFLTLFRFYSLYTQQQAGRNTLGAKDHQPDTSTNITLPTLHLLIPITSPSLLFCKSLASSILTSYPPPVLINFNTTFSQPAYARGAKLSGIADYLQSPFQLPNLPISDSDLVLIVDGFDVWYQLPPDILLHRYRGLFQQKFLHTHPVVFGADKLCWPNAASSAACTLAPESTLPRDAYGVNITDHDPSGYKVRPRFLNSGTVLGEWSVVRDVYKRAKEAARRKKGQVWSDQGVLAEVWGAMLQQEITKKTQDGVEIVMDYQSALFMTLTHAHTDLKWGLISTTTSQQTLYSISNNDFTTSMDLTLKADFLPTSSLPKLNLATNIISHYIPALLHFNGPKFPLGNEKDAGWWGRMWWFHLSPDLQLAEGNAERAREFFLEKRSEKGGASVSASVKKSGGVWTDRGEWLSWEQICGEWDHVEKGGIWWHT